MENATDAARLAAHNNADLYAAILTAHGLPFQRDEAAFVCLDDPPPYYSHITTLDPDAAAAQTAFVHQLRAEGRVVRGVKDGFAMLDPDALGLRVLFDASWTWRAGRAEDMPPGWTRIGTTGDLALWHDAWRVGCPTDHVVFPPACLDDPALAFLARRGADGIEAGCLANLSGTVVGLSNVFVAHGVPPAYPEAARAASAFGEGRPVVGYESGPALGHARAAGFEETGPLRVLVREA